METPCLRARSSAMIGGVEKKARNLNFFFFLLFSGSDVFYEKGGALVSIVASIDDCS